MNGRALIYGTIAIDTLITPGGQVNSVMGGSGPYAALAARLVTDKVDMVGVVGDDFPKAWEQALELRGVNMQHVAHEKGQTFAWTGKYEEDMHHREPHRGGAGTLGDAAAPGAERMQHCRGHECDPATSEPHVAAVPACMFPHG